jgi:archaellum component FlaC
MNIDERLERLAERHAALTQSVELLALTTSKHESNLERLEGNLERLEGNLDRLEKITESNSTIIGVLSRAVLIHEERSDRLEGNTAA